MAIKNLKQAKQGVFLLGPHLLTLEIAARLYALENNICVVYRAHKKPFINFLIKKALQKHYKKAIERTNVFGLVRALKQGYQVCYAPDIDGGYYDHRFAPFFGLPAATITAPTRIAQLTGAKTFLSSYYRRDDGTGYDIYISPELKNFPSNDIEKDLAHINQLLETAVRQKPDQYLWQYKRFKTQPQDKHGKRFY